MHEDDRDRVETDRELAKFGLIGAIVITVVILAAVATFLIVKYGLA